jgi:hypothetical protein
MFSSGGQASLRAIFIYLYTALGSTIVAAEQSSEEKADGEQHVAEYRLV